MRRGVTGSRHILKEEAEGVVDTILLLSTRPPREIPRASGIAGTSPATTPRRRGPQPWAHDPNVQKWVAHRLIRIEPESTVPFDFHARLLDGGCVVPGRVEVVLAVSLNIVSAMP